MFGNRQFIYKIKQFMCKGSNKNYILQIFFLKFLETHPKSHL
jgi:hypothetical protein